MDAVGEFAELERHMDTPVKRFSSGMVSRLSFAIAMQFPADIYVFDEVLAVVDGEFQERCLDEIKRLHAQGRTVIFVSHSLDQVAEVCERVMWLDRGQVRDLGPTDEVLAAYAKSPQASLGDGVVLATGPRVLDHRPDVPALRRARAHDRRAPCDGLSARPVRDHRGRRRR